VLGQLVEGDDDRCRGQERAAVRGGRPHGLSDG
jgi:hypothetical protein